MKDAIVIPAVLSWGIALGALVVDYLKLRKEVKGWRAWAGSLRAGRRQPPAPVAAEAPPAPLERIEDQVTRTVAAIADQDRPHASRKAHRRPSWFQIGLKREREDLATVAKRRQEELAQHRADVRAAIVADNTRPPQAPVAIVEPIEEEETA